MTNPAPAAPPKPYKIVLGWVIGGLLGIFAFDWWLKPMAGLGAMVLLIGALAVTVCPIAHVLAAKFLFPRDAYVPWFVIGFNLFILAALYFVLAATSIFNFT